MKSETVDDAQVKKYSQEWTSGHRVSFSEASDQTFGLQFGSGAVLEVFPTDEEDPDSEMTVYHSDRSSSSFNFHRGWHLN